MKVQISKIKPNPKNPRIIRDDKFEKLKKSISEFPEMLEKRPLVVFTDKDDKYVILGGNMRLRAAQDLGLKELPIILADDWTEEQKNEFLIKDNVGYGEWDWASIVNEWDKERLGDWGLDLPDFEIEEEVKVSDYDAQKTMANTLETFNNMAIKQIILYFENEEYEYILRKLDEIGKTRDLDDNSLVVKFLVDNYIANDHSDTKP